AAVEGLIKHWLVQLGDSVDVRGCATQHDPIRIQEVVDGRGLAEKLRVRNDVERKIAVSLQGILQCSARPISRADRDGRLVHDDRISAQIWRQGLDGIFQLGEVRRAVRTWWRAYAEEDEVGFR